MKAKLYTLHCLTNLHVGSGDVNFSVIDNEVARDPVTGYPTIHATGIKGAFRSHFRGIGATQEQLDHLFGKINQVNERNAGGHVKFFSANMLALPMRTSAGSKPYALVTTSTALEHLQTMVTAILRSQLPLSLQETDITVESVHCTQSVHILGTELSLMPDGDFQQIRLPVVARNCMEPGKENLWFEEVVPHQSILTFFVSSDDDSIDEFDAMVKENPIVQIGSGASIGYGVCKVTEVTL